MISILEWALDPTLLFCVGAFAAPIAVNYKKLKKSDYVGYASDPLLIFCILLVPVCVVAGSILRRRTMKDLAKRKHVQDSRRDLHAYQKINYSYLMRPLRSGERLRSRWFLLNGIIIHAYLDFCVGFMKRNALMAQSYARIDRRYAADVGSYQGSMLHLLSAVEGLVMAPLCVVLYFAFQTRHPARDALELVVCLLQAFGTVMYVGQEAFSGGRNFDLDYFYTLSMHYIIYFWFPVVIGSAIFFFVPLFLGFKSFQRLRNQVMFYQRHHYTRHSLDHVTPGGGGEAATPVPRLR